MQIQNARDSTSRKNTIHAHCIETTGSRQVSQAKEVDIGDTFCLDNSLTACLTMMISNRDSVDAIETRTRAPAGTEIGETCLTIRAQLRGAGKVSEAQQ